MTEVPPAPFRLRERFERPLLLSADDICSFAALVGDTNPLHHDQALAERSRFGALIASGTQTSALMGAFSAALVTELAPSLGLEVQFRFHRAVRAGEALRMVWEVSAVEFKASLGGHIVTLEGQLLDPAGDVSLSGRVKTLVQPRPEPATSTGARAEMQSEQPPESAARSDH